MIALPTLIGRLGYIALFLIMSGVVSINFVYAIGMIAEQVSPGIVFRAIGTHLDVVVASMSVFITGVVAAIACIRHKVPPALTTTFASYQHTSGGALLILLCVSIGSFAIGYVWGFINHHYVG